MCEASGEVTLIRDAHDLLHKQLATVDGSPDMLPGCCVQARLGCNSELILDEFGEKLLEELDYQQEARNIEVHPFVTKWQAIYTLQCVCTAESMHFHCSSPHRDALNPSIQA